MGEVGSLAALAQGVGGLSSAANGYAQSQAYAAQGKAAGRLADVNAKISDLQAADAIRRGKLTQAVVAERGRAVEGEQRVAQAAGGVDVNSGTAANMQGQTSALSYLDQLTVVNNAALEAIGYKMDAINSTAAGRTARISGRLNSGQSLISGGMAFAKDALIAGDIYDKYRVRVPVEKPGEKPPPLDSTHLEPEWYNPNPPTKEEWTSKDWD